MTLDRLILILCTVSLLIIGSYLYHLWWERTLDKHLFYCGKSHAECVAEYREIKLLEE